MPKKVQQKEEEPKAEEKEREEAELEVPSSELASLKKELEEKTALADEYLSRLKYLQADFENYKKMAARERDLYEKCATEELIKRLLPIIDALEAAFTSVEKSDDQSSILRGLELIYLDLLEALGQEGLKPIKAACEKFDPYKHEVTMTVIDDDLPEDTVVEELEKGYMLGTKVLRTSKVAVSKKAAPPQPSNQKGSDEAS